MSLDRLLYLHHTCRLGKVSKNYSGINAVCSPWHSYSGAYRHSVNPQHYQGVSASHLVALDPFLNRSVERSGMLACGAEKEEK